MSALEIGGSQTLHGVTLPLYRHYGWVVHVEPILIEGRTQAAEEIQSSIEQALRAIGFEVEIAVEGRVMLRLAEVSSQIERVND
jgi:hypothetical protein